MTVAQGILARDLARISLAERQLNGRPTTDERVIFADNFKRTTGMSPREHADRDRRIDAELAHNRLVSDLIDSEPPSNLGADIRGLQPQRARYARYHAWLAHEESKLAEAERRRDEFQSIADAPAETRNKIRDLLRKTAELLLRREPANPEAGRRAALDAELTEREHLAEAAQAAMPEIESAITRAEQRVTALREREPEFIDPAIREVMVASGLVETFRRKIAEAVALQGLLRGMGHAISWQNECLDVSIPDSVPQVDPWLSLKAAFRADPRSDASKFIGWKTLP